MQILLQLISQEALVEQRPFPEVQSNTSGEGPQTEHLNPNCQSTSSKDR